MVDSRQIPSGTKTANLRKSDPTDLGIGSWEKNANSGRLSANLKEPCLIGS